MKSIASSRRIWTDLGGKLAGEHSFMNAPRHLRLHGGQDWASFRTCHTAVITATATILWVVLPEPKVAWAVLVAAVVGLIAGNYHFVSDVILGVYLGGRHRTRRRRANAVPKRSYRIERMAQSSPSRRLDRGADPPTSVDVGSRTARALAYAVFQRYRLRAVQRHRSTSP
jgi:hypothetical protein